MKLLCLAVFLSIVQTTPPVPGQAPDNHALGGTGTADQRTRQEKPAATTTPKRLGSPLTHQYGSTDKAKYAAGDIGAAYASEAPHVSKPATMSVFATAPSWTDELTSWSTFAMFVVAAVQAAFLWCTLSYVRRQSKLMVRQNKIALKNAIAAKDSADALVKSERPWVTVYFEKIPYDIGTDIARNMSVPIDLTVQNTGRTPARLNRVGIAIRKLRPEETLPSMPILYDGDYDSCAVLCLPRDPRRAAIGVHVQSNDIFETRQQPTTIYLIVHVEYRDTIQETVLHSTRACFRYNMPERTRIKGQGFMAAYDVPESYWEAT